MGKLHSLLNRDLRRIPKVRRQSQSPFTRDHPLSVRFPYETVIPEMKHHGVVARGKWF